MDRKGIIFSFIVGAILCLNSAVLADTIAIVTKDDVSEFNDHALAVEALLKPNHTVVVVNLDPSDESDALQKVVDANPDLVYSIGSKSTQAMIRGLPTSIPLVYGMVLDVDQLDSRRLMAGRTLEISAALRLNVLKQLFPQMSRVGILEGPTNDTVAMRREYALLAKTLGLELFVEIVGKRGELQDVLNALFTRRVDIVMSAPKARIYNANDMRYLILFLSRYRVPYLALSPSYLDLGALISVDANLDIEANASLGLIESVLAKPDMVGIPRVSSPTEVTYTINSSVLRQFRFRLTQESIDGAKEMRE
ncbi:MAG: ABC transporter substrate binding protein [bacterium]|nr:ABC transporter substrate binding protein [bacterium]